MKTVLTLSLDRLATQSTFLLLPLLLILITTASPDVALAQDGFVTCNGADCGSCQLVEMVNRIILWLFGLAAVLFGVIMAVAGLGLVTSGGNTSALEAAKSKFKNAIIGLIIMMSAWLVIDILMKGLLPGDEGKINGSLFWAEVECTQQATTRAYEPPNELDPGAPVTQIPSPPSSPAGQICYAGSGNGPVCLPAHNVPNESPYNYPAGMSRPTQFVKYTDALAETRRISKYYTFCQLTRCSSGKIGDYAHLSPRAVAAMDVVTDSLGGRPLTINSGFRSPAYNSQIGGASQSTHTRGLAFDIAATGGLTTAQIENACKSAGAGWTRQYPTFTHCDWR